MGYYGSESISSLKGAETLRQRPATVLGTNDESGIFHTINELPTHLTKYLQDSETRLL